MPIESATNISQLNTSYPASTDGVKEGDDHIRLIKQVLQSTFPNITGAVTKTQAELNRDQREVPIGGIIMWSGATVPTGWALCNGQVVTRTDGGGTITTPDLRDRFIVGSGTTYTIGNTGGANTVSLTTGQLPSHTHSLNLSGTIGAAGAHSHSVNDPGHSHPYTWKTTGGGDNSGGDVNQINNGTFWTGAAATGISINAVGDHTHSLTLSGSANATGSGDAHENRPPYYALAFIMRH